MSIITLTTDFGLKDYYVGAIKGFIFQHFPEVRVVDLSHLIDPFNHTEASYLLKAAVKNFPENTIHIVGVDCEKNVKNAPVIMRWKKQFFIGTDNGILSLLSNEEAPEQVVTFHYQNQSKSTMEEFVLVAGKIIQNSDLNRIGTTHELKKVTSIQPIIAKDGNSITGSVVYIDGMGNLVFNISKKFFEEVRKGRKFEIMFKPKILRTIYENYGEVLIDTQGEQKSVEGTKVAIFNELDYLEIGTFGANPNRTGTAKTLYGFDYFDSLTIQFIP